MAPRAKKPVLVEQPVPPARKDRRITIDPDEELRAWIDAQAARAGQRPGEYLQLLARASMLAYQGDLRFLGMLVPPEHVIPFNQAARLFTRTDAPAAVPPARPGVNAAAIDDALDEYA